jgi:hypothetical protein
MRKGPSTNKVRPYLFPLSSSSSNLRVHAAPYGLHLSAASSPTTAAVHGVVHVAVESPEAMQKKGMGKKATASGLSSFSRTAHRFISILSFRYAVPKC